VLPPHWRAFPEAPPAAGLLCCVMFFDLRGQHGDVSGYGRYRAGWPFGDFEDRTSQLGDIVPSDSSRWAPYAWRTANAAELGQAHLASAFDASRHAAPQFRVAC
jgi:hypothetical protein